MGSFQLPQQLPYPQPSMTRYCRGNYDGVIDCPNQTSKMSRNLYYLLSRKHLWMLSSFPTMLIDRLGCRSKHLLSNVFPLLLKYLSSC
jgi:hypothetical protein